MNCIVISGLQAKLYPVSFSFGLAKLNKSHWKTNYLYVVTQRLKARQV